MKRKTPIAATLLTTLTILSLASLQSGHAQILVSSGNYSQNFDSLLNSGTANPWADNSTLPGWYASRASGGTFTVYRAGTGTDNNGALYSFGEAASTERALGSASSGTPGTIAYGVRFTNDTALVVTSLTITYTGEQWRNGGNISAQPLSFSYRVSADTSSGSDPTNGFTWTAVPALSFITPTVGSTSAALLGNDATNKQTFSNILLDGVAVAPGQEFFFRWVDINDAGNDHGLAIDDLTISFATVPPNLDPPTITTQPQSQTITQGNNVTFTVAATGMIPFTYQWYFDNSPITDATNNSLALTFVNTNQAGAYFVAVTNGAGGVESDDAILTVNLPTVTPTNIAYLRTLQGNPNYVPTNTSTLYSARGVVTSYVNMTGNADAQFYMQDETAGLAVFVSGGSTVRPANGDYVEVIGPLGHFNGLFELNLVASNPSHSVTVISNGAALPAPIVFDLASLTNIPYMEGLVEGSRVVISNVFIQGAGGFFVSGSNTNMTNFKNEKFPLRIDSRVLDMVNQPIPEFVASITGVVGQFGSAPSYTNGYQFFPLQYTDLVIVPVPVSSIPLNISLVGADAAISWLSAAQGFTLQGNTDLATPNWQSILDTPTIVNNFNVITIPATNSQYFRLIR